MLLSFTLLTFRFDIVVKLTLALFILLRMQDFKGLI
jgi:hypothetical protein